MKKYYLFAFVGFLFFYFSYNAPQTKAEPAEKIPNPYLRKVIDEFDLYLQKAWKQGEFPGAGVAIVKDGVVVYAKGLGFRNVKTKVPVDEHTVFRLASVSKSFAAVLTGILVAEGELEWEDKVKNYLPDFKLKDQAQSQRVQLHHLLSHTTGLPYHTYTNLVEAGLTTEEILPQLSSVDLIGEEGAIYSYQNAAYSLIAPVIEAKTKVPYENLLTEKIFAPLDMKNASYSFEAITKNNNVAQPYRKSGKKWLRSKISKKYYNSIPAGGLNASASDMAAYLQLLLGHHPDLINQKTLEQVFKPLVKTPIKRRYFGKWPAVKEAHYAKGFRVLQYGDQRMIYHGGSANAYHSELAIWPEEQLGICILMNAPTKFSNQSIPAFFDAYQTQSDSIQIWSDLNGTGL